MINDMQNNIDKILSCGFECEAGPLSKSAQFEAIQSALKYAPEYRLGQSVEVHLKVTVDGQDFEKWQPGVVTSITSGLSDQGDKAIHKYRISGSRPQEWHAPKTIASNIGSGSLRARSV